MSVVVDVEALADQVRQHGPAAFLISVSDDGRPHVVSVSVSVDDGLLRARVGRHSSANLRARPDLTLLWPAGPGAAYSLLVDGHVEAVLDPAGGPVAVRPTSAVLHRVADAAGSGPSCLPVESA
jgi:hypothetical protein